MKSRLLIAVVGMAAGVGCEVPDKAVSPLGPLRDNRPLPRFDDRVELWKEKTVMVVAPHPDDDTFGCAGIMAILARNKNRVIVVIYTNDDKGSQDPEMTGERLAEIRKMEEENACRVLGIPAENIVWLGHGDGMLEYVPAEKLCKEMARLIRVHRPHAIFSIDPGKDYMQWHKTDHRAAAFNTVDAIRAAQWPLYFPELLQTENLKAYEVPVCYFYYSVEPNYAVDIQEVEGLKLNAALSHESQFEPAIRKYQPMSEGVRQMLTAGFRKQVPRRNGRCVEYFRRVDGGF